MLLLVRSWLGETSSRLREAGFEYFKLDFLQLVLNARRFHDPSVPRGQLIRLAAEAIRKAVGDESYVMGMGDMGSAGGLIYAARIAGDIHNFGGHIRQNALSAAVHYWKHRRLWNNDVDFAISAAGR